MTKAFIRVMQSLGITSTTNVNTVVLNKEKILSISTSEEEYYRIMKINEERKKSSTELENKVTK